MNFKDDKVWQVDTGMIKAQTAAQIPICPNYSHSALQHQLDLSKSLFGEKKKPEMEKKIVSRQHWNEKIKKRG